MRSATIIVGAIAVASCLIAAALVLSKDDSSPKVQRVARQPQGSTESTAPAGLEGSGGGALTSCNDQVSVGPETSCYLGLNVRRAYEKRGSSGEVSADDPATGRTVTVDCQGEAAPTICEGEGATIYLAP